MILNKNAQLNSKSLTAISSVLGYEYSDPNPYNALEILNHWFRPLSIERWEMQSLELNDDIISKFQALNMDVTIMPSKSEYDYCYVQGANVNRMNKRLDFLKSNLNNGLNCKNFIFASGDRPLVDSEKDFLQNFLSKNSGSISIITESDAASAIFQKKFPNIECHYINAEGKIDENMYHRPSANDTLYKFLEEDLPLGDILYFSNQPYLAYHDAVVKNAIISSGKIYTIKTVGEGCDLYDHNDLLDTFIRTLDAELKLTVCESSYEYMHMSLF